MRPTAVLIVAALLIVTCNGDAGSESGSPTSTRAVSTSPGESTVTPAPTDLTCWTAPAEGGSGEIRFEDRTESWGLLAPLTGMYAHAAAFGDIDADLRPDLVVGTFADREPKAYRVRGAAGPNPDRLLVAGLPFRLEEWSEELARTSGAVFADLDGDADQDLVLIRHAGISGDFGVPSRIYENDQGVLVPSIEPLPTDFRGRTPTAADFDGDGLLDLYVSEDRFGERGGILLRNQGGLVFTDVTAGSGLEGVFALSSLAADLNGDRLPDLVTSTAVFLNEGSLSFEEVTPTDFVPEPVGEEDDPAGVAVGDVNGDGYPDIVVGQHYRATVELDSEIPIRLFLNRGPDPDGGLRLTDVTEASGLTPLPTLAPQVQIADLDNDGWPEIVTSASAGDGAVVAVFRNLGGPQPSFQVSPGLGSDQYWVGAPVVDVDRDGRLDVFAVEWESSLPSVMMRNVTDAGHWLEVSVDGAGGGVGSLVTVTGEDGVSTTQEITAGGGYASGTPPVAHFGLGERTSVSVTIDLPDGTRADLGTVGVDRHLRWPDGCS